MGSLIYNFYTGSMSIIRYVAMSTDSGLDLGNDRGTTADMNYKFIPPCIVSAVVGRSRAKHGCHHPLLGWAQ